MKWRPYAPYWAQQLANHIDHRLDRFMSELDDRLTALQQSFDAFRVDLDRELQDLKDALAGTLTAEQAAQFDALSGKIQQATLDIDTADPQATQPEPPT